MKDTNEFPWYVRAGLFGIHSRKGALTQFWFVIGVSLILLSLGLYSDSFLWTIVFCASLLLTAKLVLVMHTMGRQECEMGEVIETLAIWSPGMEGWPQMALFAEVAGGFLTDNTLFDTRSIS